MTLNVLSISADENSHSPVWDPFVEETQIDSYQASSESDRIEVSSVIMRLYNSRVVQLAVVIGVIGISVAVIALTAPHSMAVGSAALGAAIIGGGCIASGKKILHEVSLTWTVVMNKLFDNRGWYHEINDKIILGAIPLKNYSHHEMLKDFAILSLVEDSEFYDMVIVGEPVTPEDWVKLGVPHKHISTEDFHAVSAENIKEAVEWIESQDRRVYIHCKAGRGRSGAVAVAHMCKTEGITTDEAEERIKNIRSFIAIDKSKAEIQKYLQEI